MCVPGKGKTPLRRSNCVAVAVSVDETKPKMLESSCEKSCQVTSEQIKADMKAAAENSRRTSSKGFTTEAVETTARPVLDTGNTGATAGSTVRPVTGSVCIVGSGAATSRQLGGCGRVVGGTTHRATTTINKATGSSTNDSGAQTGDSSSGPAYVDAAVNHASRRTELLAGQGERQPVRSGCASATGSVSQQGQARDEDFVPRRPLTRSCTRMSSVSLISETGKTEHKTLSISVH